MSAKARLLSIWLCGVVALAILGTSIGCNGTTPTATLAPSPTATSQTQATATPAPAATTPPTATATVIPTSAGSVTAPAEAPRRGGQLIRGISAGLRQWFYLPEAVWYAPQNLQRVYSNLIQFSPADGTTLVPDLATSWNFSTDLTSLTFNIRSGVKWQDGQPLTMDDIVSTFELDKNPPSGVTFPRLTAFSEMKSIQASGANQVTVTLSQPDATFLQQFAGAWGIILPKHVMDMQGGINGADRIVGTGPFEMAPSDINSYITTKANPDYYINAPDGKPYPYLSEVTTVILPDPNARAAAMQSGRIDISSYDPAEFADAAELEKSLSGKAEMQVSPLAGVNAVFLNGLKPPFDNLQARQAVDLAFDRTKMQDLQKLPSGENTTEITSYLGTTDPFLDQVKSLPINDPAHRSAELAKAQDLLKQTGLTGFTLTLASTPPFFQEMGQEIAQVYQDAGIKVTLDVMDTTAEAAAVNAGNFEATIDTPNEVLPSPIQMIRAEYLPSGRKPYIAKPPQSFTDLLNKAIQTASDSESKQMVGQLSDIMRNDWVPSVPFGKQSGSIEIVRDYVHGRNAALGQWFNLQRWDQVWVDSSSPRG